MSSRENCPPSSPVRTDDDNGVPLLPLNRDDRGTVIPPTPNDSADDSKRRLPLMLRRLQDHIKPGIKQAMKNPAGRRARVRNRDEE